MSVESISKEDLMQEQILGAAKRLFSQYGFAKVTMDDVAKAIGKGRSTLYYYYKSKDEVLDAVITKQIHETHTLIQKEVDASKTVEEKIDAFYVAKFKMAHQKHSFFDALELGMDADAISNFFQVKLNYYKSTTKWEGTLLTQILSDGMANGEINELSADEIENLVFILLSVSHGIKRKIRLENRTLAVEPMLKQLSHLLMHGLKK